MRPLTPPRASSPRRSTARRGAWIALAIVLAGVLVAALLASCSQTPTQVPLRTFERAQRLDLVCLQVDLDVNGNPQSIIPQPQSACAPIPPDVSGQNLQNQLFALVTQSARGELAVVDLTVGVQVDQNHGVPGVNFLPVGAIPTDVAATPDSRMIFVGSGEPNKFAVYGIPGHKILGDYAGHDPSGTNNTLPAWPVCALPQRPGAVAVVPRLAAGVPTSTPTSDGGAAEAGAAEAGAPEAGAPGDGGAPAPAAASATSVAVDYDLVVVLPGDRTSSAKVVTIDPKPFLRAVPRLGPDGKPAEDFGAGATLAPGELQPCPITAAIELVGPQAIPASVDAGAPWDDGVKYVDGGVDLTCSEPAVLPRCGLRPCACASPDVPVEAGVADAGSVDAGDAGDAGAGTPAAACDPNPPSTAAPPITFAFPPLDQPQPIAIARDDQFLFVADDALPLIHVVDLTNPAAPQELLPFIVSSMVDPTRVVGVRDIAVSPPTREFKRYLYAVDHREGTLAVFDVTDPRTADRSPLRRPHAELNPFEPPDRITFSSPAVAVAFAQQDVPLTRMNGVPLANGKALTGLLCNPNPNLSPTTNAAADPGVFYRADSTDPISPNPLGPFRLRGVFGFATLSNGQVIVLDVDDWDAPCRRPQNLTGPPTVTATTSAPADVGVLAAAQPPPTGPTDYDPYHAPNAAPEGVTSELFYPVSAPHRLRSQFFLRDDPTTGKHVPYVAAVPAIQSIGAPLPLVGQGSEATPRLRPTAILPGVPAGTEDTGIRFSLDTPEVQIDQDWSLTYEGPLPGFDGFSATLDTTDNYSSLVLTQPQVHFCARGVEDWSVGGERANAITNALAASGRAGYPEPLLARMVDYVELTEDLLDPADAYWTLPDDPNIACWDSTTQTAADRYNACLGEFGGAGDKGGTRDLPILEAYDDHVVVGTFGITSGRKTREAVFKDPYNAPALKRVRCCFHNQVRFHVRTGSEWAAVGSIVGFLSHIKQDDGGRCVPSCELRETLLNGRVPSLPFGGAGAPDFAPFRDSPLALRNPMFSLFVQNGNKSNVDVLPQVDTSWTFSTRGQYTPLFVNIAPTTTLVDPQSMRFLAPIGQLAVVDAQTQGLVLIDLSTVALARAPFF